MSGADTAPPAEPTPPKLSRVLRTFAPHWRDLWGIPGLKVSFVFFAGYLGAVIASATRTPLVAGIAMAAMAIVEASDLPSAEGTERTLTGWRRGLDIRSSWRHLLFVAALAAGEMPHRSIFTYAALAFTVTIAVRVVRSERLRLYSDQRIRPLGSLTEGADRLRHAMRVERLRDQSELPLQASLLISALLLSIPGTSSTATTTAIVVACVVVAGTLVYAGTLALDCRRLRFHMLELHDAEVLAAFRATDRDVLCYFNGHPGSTYAVDVWLRTFEESDHDVGLVYRHTSVHEVGTDDLPAIVVRKDADVARVVGPRTRVALYPANGTLNVHLQRDTRLAHVFLGHGDSDKAGSASPFTRSYDEVWVSGDAAIDRYRAAGVDIPPDRFVRIGRPPLSPRVRSAETARAAEAAHERGQEAPLERLRAALAAPAGEPGPVVLYAPTWEGYFDDSDYSSVASMGMEIVTTLLHHLPEARIAVKPHPLTGNRRQEIIDVVEEMEAALTAAPGVHPRATDHPDASLYDWFEVSDLLITDVSSVLTDYLAWDRPVVVTNPRRHTLEDLAARFPSTTGSHVLTPGSPANGVMLRSALEHDPLAPKRRAAAVRIIGDPDSDWLEDFDRAVTGLTERAGKA